MALISTSHTLDATGTVREPPAGSNAGFIPGEREGAGNAVWDRMCSSRAWDIQGFQQLLLSHPLGAAPEDSSLLTP